MHKDKWIFFLNDGKSNQLRGDWLYKDKLKMGPFTGLWFVCMVLCSLQCTNPGAITDTQTSARCGECVCMCVHVCGRKRSINRLSIKPWPMPVSPRKRVKRESHGPWEGKGGGCGGGAGARSLSVSESRAWFDIWYWACGIWMQIYFDCPSVCLVYEESIGDLWACISERAGSETQKDTKNYSDVLYYSPIHLH